MIRKLKQKAKEFDTWFWNIFFKHVKAFPALKYYPKGRNHLYDILVEEKRNDNFVIFDIGANIGQTAKFYNNLLSKPQIYSFEPVTSTFNQLNANIKESNISCFEYALGAKKEKVEIVVDDSNNGLNSLVKNVYSSLNTGKTEIVEVHTVDEIFEKLNLDRIDILKIDTEGFDLEVLHGSKNVLSDRKVKYVFCEVGFNNEPNKGNFYEINKLLRKYDFWLCGFYDFYRWGDSFTYTAFCNALFKLVEDVA
jgi:FkbM family methyltransferase